MLYFSTYKLICLLAGLVLILLGFRLFVKKSSRKAGELDFRWKDFTLSVRNGSPGLFLLLFGAIIIAFTIYKGADITEKIYTPLPTARENPQSSMDSVNLSKDSFPIR